MNTSNNDDFNLPDNSKPTDIRKLWYSHVLNMIERLDSNIDNVSVEVREFKDKILDELGQLKESIQKDMSSCKEKSSNRLETALGKCIKKIEDLERKIERFEQSESIDLKDINKDLKDLSKRIASMEGFISNLKVKIGVIVSAVMAFCAFLWLFVKPILAKLIELIINNFK